MLWSNFGPNQVTLVSINKDMTNWESWASPTGKKYIYSMFCWYKNSLGEAKIKPSQMDGGMIHLASATNWNLRFNYSNLLNRRGFLDACDVSRMLPLLSFNCNVCTPNHPVICKMTYPWGLRAFRWFIDPYTKHSQPPNKLHSGKNAVHILVDQKQILFKGWRNTGFI